MGAEASSSLKAYSFKAVESTGTKNQSMCEVIRKDGKIFTAFCWNQSSGQEVIEFATNATQYLKILRHPGIVKYLDCIKTSKEIYLLTEKVSPLSSVLETLTPLEIIAGIHNVVEAVAFLHEKCKLSHNNICIDSIYITECGRWKLAGMQFLCPFGNLKKGKVAFNVNSSCLYPEDKPSNSKSLQYKGHERDSYAVAYLIHEISEDYLKDEVLLKELISSLVPFLSEIPSSRPPVRSLLASNFLRNEYLSIRNFLENLTMKSSDEKIEFFSSVARKLYDMPESVVASKLSPLLFSRLVLLDSSAKEFLLPHLFSTCQVRGTSFVFGQVNPVFQVDNFVKHIIPQICKILNLRDVSIRLVLLHFFSHYVDHIPKPTLQRDILPKVLLGLKDTNDILVAASLRALADMVPVLGGSVVIGANQSKLFIDALPKKPKIEKNYEDGINEKNNKTRAPTDEPIEHETQIESITAILPDKKEKITFSKPQDERLEKIHTSSPVQIWSPDVVPDVFPERSSPDGGEDFEASKSPADLVVETTNAGWSDWDSIESDDEENESLATDEPEKPVESKPSTLLTLSKSGSTNDENINVNRTRSYSSKHNPLKLSSVMVKKMPDDVTATRNQNLGNELDIFASFKPIVKKEVDLFEDMQPTISKSSDALLPSVVEKKEEVSSKLFEVVLPEISDQVESGWGDDLDDWGSFP